MSKIYHNYHYALFLVALMFSVITTVLPANNNYIEANVQTIFPTALYPELHKLVKSDEIVIFYRNNCSYCVKAKNLLKRYDRLKAQRQNWESHWQEVADYMQPRKADVTKTRSKGDKRTELGSVMT